MSKYRPSKNQSEWWWVLQPHGIILYFLYVIDVNFEFFADEASLQKICLKLSEAKLLFHKFLHVYFLNS